MNTYSGERRVTVTNRFSACGNHIHLKKGCDTNRAWLKTRGGTWHEYPSVYTALNSPQMQSAEWFYRGEIK